MRSGSVRFFVPAILLLTASPLLAGPRVHRGPTSPKVFKTRTKAAPKTMSSIGPERATQIQTALIKSGYMTGAPSGVWDTQTETAMLKLQADNGWQTKFVPDSRAIIHLGLGPNAASGAANEVETAETPGQAETTVGTATNR